MKKIDKDLQVELDRQRRQVDLENFDLTLGELVRMAESGELVRAPEYQRKFRWTHKDESYLIESLFLGLPVPSIWRLAARGFLRPPYCYKAASYASTESRTAH